MLKYQSYFIHSSTDGQLGRLQILAIVNNAATNIGVLIFFQSIVFSFSDKFPEAEFLGNKAVPFLILLYTEAAAICIPTNIPKLSFLHFLASTCFLLIY